MKSALDPRAGATVTGLFLGSLAIAGAVAFVTAPITPRMAVARDDVANERSTMMTVLPILTQAATGASVQRPLIRE